MEIYGYLWIFYEYCMEIYGYLWIFYGNFMDIYGHYSVKNSPKFQNFAVFETPPLFLNLQAIFKTKLF